MVYLLELIITLIKKDKRVMNFLFSRRWMKKDTSEKEGLRKLKLFKLETLPKRN